MKTKFYINVHFDVVVPTEVIAESENEALDIALANTEFDPNSIDYCKIRDACVTDSEKVGD